MTFSYTDAWKTCFYCFIYFKFKKGPHLAICGSFLFFYSSCIVTRVVYIYICVTFLQNIYLSAAPFNSSGLASLGQLHWACSGLQEVLYLDSSRGSKTLKGIQIVSKCTFLQCIYLLLLLNSHNAYFFVIIYPFIFFVVLLQNTKMRSVNFNHLTDATSDKTVPSYGTQYSIIL